MPRTEPRGTRAPSAEARRIRARIAGALRKRQATLASPGAGGNTLSSPLGGQAAPPSSAEAAAPVTSEPPASAPGLLACGAQSSAELPVTECVPPRPPARGGRPSGSGRRPLPLPLPGGAPQQGQRPLPRPSCAAGVPSRPGQRPLPRPAPERIADGAGCAASPPSPEGLEDPLFATAALPKRRRAAAEAVQSLWADDEWPAETLGIWQ